MERYDSFCLGILYLQLAHHTDDGRAPFLGEALMFSLLKRAPAWTSLPPSLQLWLSLRASGKGNGFDTMLLAIESSYRSVTGRARACAMDGALIATRPAHRASRPMSQANRAVARPNNEVFDLSKESFGLRAFCPGGPLTTGCSSSIVQNAGVRPFLRATLNPDLLQRKPPQELQRLSEKLAAVKISNVRYEPFTSPTATVFRAKVEEIYGKDLPHLVRKRAADTTNDASAPPQDPAANTGADANGDNDKA
jgi:hypothetical protein